ncbi:hypothetical protein ID866_8766, partial [Astraeus odoratus]
SQEENKAKYLFYYKENATLAQQIEILNWHHKNSKRLKKETIASAMGNSNTRDHSAKHAQKTQHPQVTEMIDLWVSQAMDDGILLTREVLCQKWLQFVNLAGVPTNEHLLLSNGWLA